MLILRIDKKKRRPNLLLGIHTFNQPPLIGGNISSLESTKCSLIRLSSSSGTWQQSTGPDTLDSVQGDKCQDTNFAVSFPDFSMCSERPNLWTLEKGHNPHGWKLVS